MSSSDRELPPPIEPPDGNWTPDNPISENEVLYRRCDAKDFAPTGRLEIARIGFHGWSLNRSKYSIPRQVLIPDREGCVGAIRASDVPARIVPDPPATPYDFKVVHTPQEEDVNYAHSEFVALKDGNPVPRPDPSKDVKKRFRSQVSDALRRLRDEELDTTPAI